MFFTFFLAVVVLLSTTLVPMAMGGERPHPGLVVTSWLGLSLGFILRDWAQIATLVRIWPVVAEVLDWEKISATLDAE
jgi:hypothetical protein